MDIDELANQAKLSIWSSRRFLLLIIGFILIACGLVFISMVLYSTSGTAQLDLSRPGYIDVRGQTIDSSSEFKNYPDSGSINQAAITEFNNLYDSQVNKIKLANAFSGDPLDINTLGINSNPDQQ